MALAGLVKRCAVTYTPREALSLVRAYAIAPFDESVEISVRLNVDPKKGDQLVRGSCAMPAGLGKQVRVAVFTSSLFKEEALEAGADLAGEELIEEVKEGNLNFEKALATQEMLDSIKPLGRILGPRGLMPALKFGTVIPREELKEAIGKLKQGQVQFRVDVGGIVHSLLGKVSFTDEALMVNMRAIVEKLVDLKPTTVKGKYLRSAHLTSTQGPAWELDLTTIDPNSPKCEL